MADALQTYEQLDTAFRHRNFKPLYFVYGEEAYLTERLQRTLIEHALQPHEQDFNFDLVYGAESEVQQVMALCSAFPMMAERRLIVVRDFEKLNGNARFTEYAKQPNPSAIVFLACRSKPNLSQNPYRALKKHAESAEFKALYPRQMPGWIKGQVEKEGRRIKPDAAQMLAELTGTDLRTAALEIEKLLAFAGDRTTLTGDDVLDVGGHSRTHNVFELQKAISGRRYGASVTIMERMLRSSTNPRSAALMIVAVLTGYFVKLQKLTSCQGQRMRDADMAKRIGVSPYFVKEYVAALRAFPPALIAQAFATLAAADFALKGGSTHDEALVLALALRRLTGADQARNR
ncbi:MAG: DNA polymerase III subunit delta [Bacteroidota bacterium]